MAIEPRRERHAVMHVGSDQDEGERDTLTVCDEVAFGAGTATVGRGRRGGSKGSRIDLSWPPR